MLLTSAASARAAPAGVRPPTPCPLRCCCSAGRAAAGAASSSAAAAPRPPTAAARRVRAAAVATPAPSAAASSSGDLEVVSDGPPAVEVSAIHSPEELEAVLAAYPERVVVLMCKASSCRPCKMFKRKYERIAASYAPAAVFLEITGDESKETRGMMMAMAVRVTPTFFLWDAAPRRSTGEAAGGAPPATRTATGVNENNLRAAVDAVLAGQGAD